MNRSDHREDAVLVLLAGSFRVTQLQRDLGIPTLCLPIVSGSRLLDLWIDLAAATPGIREVRVALDAQADLRPFEAPKRPRAAALPVSIVADQGPWRGSAGAILDAAAGSPRANRVVAADANCLPPESLAGVLHVLDADVDAVIGGTAAGAPRCVYGLAAEALEAIPEIGYFDLKEQLLPRLYAAGRRATLLPFADDVCRIREREDYLAAVAAWTRRAAASNRGVDQSESRVLGDCLIGDRVRLEPHAVVSDSVVFDDAVIGRGSLVHRCVVGPGSVIEAGDEVVDRVVIGPREPRRRSQSARTALQAGSA